jgi:putative hydrolase of the HAD superfamily
MKYKNVFFDLDRTLWDFEKNTIETLKNIFDSLSLRIYFPSFHEFYITYRKINETQWELYRQGKITKEFLTTNRFYLTLKEAGADNIKLAEEIGIKYVEETPLRTALFPHTHEVLAYLKEKYDLYILTNGFRQVQDSKVERCNLTPYFKEIIASEDCGHMKPSQLFFGYVIDKLKVLPSESIMIGDDLKVDIEGAAQAGIDTIFFNSDEIKHSAHPTFEIKSLDQIKDIL